MRRTSAAPTSSRRAASRASPYATETSSRDNSSSAVARPRKSSSPRLPAEAGSRRGTGFTTDIGKPLQDAVYLAAPGPGGDARGSSGSYGWAGVGSNHRPTDYELLRRGSAWVGFA